MTETKYCKETLNLINIPFSFFIDISAMILELTLYFYISELKFYLDKHCMKGYKFSRDD